MIETSLNNLIAILDELIALTNEDIAAIKAAKHSGVMASVERKNELVEEFKKQKRIFDKTSFERFSGDTQELAKLLSDTETAKLAEFKQKMKDLHKINKDYAKLILAVKNYIDGMVNSMLNENSGEYGKENTKSGVNALLKMNV